MPSTEIFKNGEDKMHKCISQTKKEFAAIRTGRANPMILERINVEYYGTPTPLRQLSNVTVQDGQTLVIQPFDRSAMKDVERAIMKAELGIAPNSDGTCIRLTFPPLTEDRRKEIVKDVKKISEESKVAVRNVRRDVADAVKKLEKEENVPEDEVKKLQEQVQKMTDKYTRIIDDLTSEKEKEVLTV